MWQELRRLQIPSNFAPIFAHPGYSAAPAAILTTTCGGGAQAALEAVWCVPCGGVPYGDDNLVFVANDWHTALLPVYLQVGHLAA